MSQFNNPAQVSIPGTRQPTAVRRVAGTTAPNLPGATVAPRITDTPPVAPVTEGQKLAADLGRVLGLGIEAAEATVRRNTTLASIDRRLTDEAALVEASGALQDFTQDSLDPGRDDLRVQEGESISEARDRIAARYAPEGVSERFRETFQRQLADSIGRQLAVQEQRDAQRGREVAVLAIQSNIGTAISNGELTGEMLSDRLDMLRELDVSETEAYAETGLYAARAAANRGDLDALRVAEDFLGGRFADSGVFSSLRGLAEEEARNNARDAAASLTQQAFRNAYAVNQPGLPFEAIYESIPPVAMPDGSEYRVPEAQAKRLAAQAIIQQAQDEATQARLAGDEPINPTAEAAIRLNTLGIRYDLWDATMRSAAQATISNFDGDGDDAVFSGIENAALLYQSLSGTGYTSGLDENTRSFFDTVDFYSQSSGNSVEGVRSAAKLAAIKHDRIRRGQVPLRSSSSEQFRSRAEEWWSDNRGVDSWLGIGFVSQFFNGLTGAEEKDANTEYVQAYLRNAYDEYLTITEDGTQAMDFAVKRLAQDHVGFGRRAVNVAGLSVVNRAKLLTKAEELRDELGGPGYTWSLQPSPTNGVYALQGFNRNDPTRDPVTRTINVRQLDMGDFEGEARKRLAERQVEIGLQLGRLEFSNADLFPQGESGQTREGYMREFGQFNIETGGNQ